MLKYPTPSNPLILRYKGRVPALKNEKTIIHDRETGKPKLIPDKEISKFVKRSLSNSSQILAQGFERIAFPQAVGVYVDMFFAIKETHRIPTSDGDNAYTTLQETWQPREAKQLGAVLGVIDDDRQVMSCAWETYPVPNEHFEGGIAYLWCLDLDRDRREQRDEFNDWLKTYNEPMTYRDDDTIDFNEIDQLLDK